MVRICVFLALISFGCTGNQQPPANTNEEPAIIQANFYGKKITEENAITGKELKEKMATTPSLDAKVKGEIVEVCQSEGCWVNIDNGDGSITKVKFREHGFFVPKDIQGKLIIAEGHAQMDTIPVETLKDYAEDAHKPKEEIDAITEPEVNLVFNAEGIIVK